MLNERKYRREERPGYTVVATDVAPDSCPSTELTELLDPLRPDSKTSGKVLMYCIYFKTSSCSAFEARSLQRNGNAMLIEQDFWVTKICVLACNAFTSHLFGGGSATWIGPQHNLDQLVNGATVTRRKRFVITANDIRHKSG